MENEASPYNHHFYYIIISITKNVGDTNKQKQNKTPEIFFFFLVEKGTLNLSISLSPLNRQRIIKGMT